MSKKYTMLNNILKFKLSGKSRVETFTDGKVILEKGRVLGVAAIREITKDSDGHTTDYNVYHFPNLEYFSLANKL